MRNESSLDAAEERSLRASLTALADAERSDEAPPRVEAALLQAWDAGHRRHRSARVRRIWLLPAAAALLLAVTGHFYRDGNVPVADPASAVVARDTRLEAQPAADSELSRELAPAQDPAIRRRRLASRDDVERQSVALVGGPLVSGEPLQLLRMRVDRDTLASMGLRSLSTPEATMVDIELIVGEDGVARGIRVGD